MRALTKAQRAGILERLGHNHKYEVVVSYAPMFPEGEALKLLPSCKRLDGQSLGLS